MLNDYIKEEINIISDKVKFLRNVLLAIISGVIGLIFGFSQNKITINFLIIGLFIVGILVIFLISFRINYLETEREKLILKLKDRQ